MPRVPARSAALAALGRSVRDYRIERGISQEELGFRSGLDRTYVGSVERGERNATYETLIKLTDGLGVELVAVMERAETYRRDGRG